MNRLLFIILILFSFNTLSKPLVIAHRGASGYLPEHTLESTVLAFSQSADFIEQDIVLSKDLVPVVLHDIHLDTVTDVALKFPQRSRDDGRFYAFDFTLKELKTLTVHERKTLEGQQVYPKRYQGSSSFTIPTFEEIIELINQLNRQFNGNTGLYIEIKSPAWHKQQGADISKVVLAILREYQLDAPDKAVYLQCFDFAETKRLRLDLGAKAKLVQLIGENDWQESTTDYEYLKSKEGLIEVAKVANGIGPWIPQLIDFTTRESTQLAAKAHELGLVVHPYTFREDDLPHSFNSIELLEVLFNQQNVNGLFTDFPDVVGEYLSKLELK